MEPIKNTNFNTNTGDSNNLNPFGVNGSNSNSPRPSFSAHAPSALDRLMNPSIDTQPPVPPSRPVSVDTRQQSAVPPSSLSSSPSSSFAQKPVVQTPVVQTSSVQAPAQPSPVQTSSQVSSTQASSAQTSTSQFSTTQSSTSSFKPYTPPTNPVNNSQFGTNSSFVPPGAAFVPPTVSKLNSEVSSILNGSPKVVVKKSKRTLILIVLMILVLILMAGAGYYWYSAMYLPSKNSNVEITTTEDSNSQFADTESNTARESAFPTAATKPIAPASNVSTQKTPATNSKTPTNTKNQTAPVASVSTRPTRVTTPFTQDQRDTVASYIVKNINTFAIPKSNKKYEVTDVSFDGPDRAIVQYTNGTASYTGIAVASIDTADTVRIVSFSLLEK